MSLGFGFLVASSHYLVRWIWRLWLMVIGEEGSFFFFFLLLMGCERMKKELLCERNYSASRLLLQLQREPWERERERPLFLQIRWERHSHSRTSFFSFPVPFRKTTEIFVWYFEFLGFCVKINFCMTNFFINK